MDPKGPEPVARIRAPEGVAEVAEIVQQEAEIAELPQRSRYELRGFNAAREQLHLRFSGYRRWGHDERKEMSSFSEMVSEMAFLPSDGASDLPLEIQYMGFHGSISWFRFLARRRAAFQEEFVRPRGEGDKFL
ncbi:hypothetical protein DY000_02025246 [Brassica cretica]|uniref:Uncharacterized protein n=1 Tax=Brassica cretica TaxID=69181 RepID=A0ABQ7E655_BRACR|nr:hypothetical protein DY000_02025246 [Brassica cretica]